MILRTLDGTSWSIADVIGAIGTGTNIFNIHFTSNDQEYTSIRFEDGPGFGRVYYGDTLVNTRPGTGWVDAKYQQVAITGGIDSTNPTLLTWFIQYAKSTTPSRSDAAVIAAIRDIAEAVRDGGNVPDPSTANVGDVLTKGESGLEWAPSKELPAVSSSDNGKVLGVSSGAWNKIDLPQDIFVATYTYANNAWSCDKTFAEIDAAYHAGKLCLANFGYQYDYTVGYIYEFFEGDITWHSVFIDGQGNGSIGYRSYVHDVFDEIWAGSSGYSVLPSIDPEGGEDEGKVLGVSEGEWAIVDPPTELPAVTASDEGKVLGVDSSGDWDKLNSVNNINIQISSMRDYDSQIAEGINVTLRDTMYAPYNLYVNGRSAYLEEFSYHDPEDPLSHAGEFSIIVPHALIRESPEIGQILTGTMHISAQYMLDHWEAHPITVDSYDTLPSGGSQGQVLKKASSNSFDCVWANESGGGGGDAIMTLIPIVDAGFDIKEIVEADGTEVTFERAAIYIMEAGDEAPNQIFKLLMKGNDPETGVFFDSEAYVTALTGFNGNNNITGIITFKIPDTKVSGLNDVVNGVAPGKFPQSMTDLYIKWTRDWNSYEQDYVEAFEYVPVCSSIPLDNTDEGTKFLCWNASNLEFRYPTARFFNVYLWGPEINYAVSLGFSAFLQDVLANGSSTQVVDMSGSDYKFRFDELIAETAFMGEMSLAYDFWGFDWNGTYLPFRVINSAIGIELRSMFIYPVQNVGIFNLDITIGFFGLSDEMDPPTYSNEMIVISGTSTPLSSITPIVPPAPPSND